MMSMTRTMAVTHDDSIPFSRLMCDCMTLTITDYSLWSMPVGYDSHAGCDSDDSDYDSDCDS